MNLVANRNVAVEGILRVRVCRQRANKKGAVRKRGLHGVLIVVVDDLDRPAAFCVLTHPADIVVQKIEALQRLHQRRRRNVGL